MLSIFSYAPLPFVYLFWWGICSNPLLMFKQGDLCFLIIGFFRVLCIVLICFSCLCHTHWASSIHVCRFCLPASVSSWVRNTWNVPSPQPGTSRLRGVGTGSSPTVTSKYLAASQGVMTESERSQPGWVPFLRSPGLQWSLHVPPKIMDLGLLPLPRPRADSETISEQHIQRL